MAWKAEVIADDSGQWTANSLRFATEAEAKGYVADLYSRWTAVRQTRATECDDPVTSTWPIDRPTAPPLPRSPFPDLAVTPITDVDQFVKDIMGQADDPLGDWHGRNE